CAPTRALAAWSWVSGLEEDGSLARRSCGLRNRGLTQAPATRGHVRETVTCSGRYERRSRPLEQVGGTVLPVTRLVKPACPRVRVVEGSTSAASGMRGIAFYRSSAVPKRHA